MGTGFVSFSYYIIVSVEGSSEVLSVFKGVYLLV